MSRSPRAKAVQRDLYYRYRAAGVCWSCKEEDVHAPGAALCRECIDAAKVKRDRRDA